MRKRRLLVQRIGQLCVAVSLVAVFGSPGVFDATPAGATACSTAANRFSGYIQGSSSGNIGTAATIILRQPIHVCSGGVYNNNFSISWEMLQGTNNSTGAEGYTQSGIFNWANPVIQPPCAFAEYDPDGSYYGAGFTRDFYCGSSVSVGSSLYYTSAYDAGCHCSHNAVGFVTISSTNFDPTTIWNTTLSTYSSEAVYADTGVPGSSSSPAAYQILKYQQGISGSWIAGPSGLGQAWPVQPWSVLGPIYLNSFLSYQT